jgi:hypothetical protein
MKGGPNRQQGSREHRQDQKELLKVSKGGCVATTASTIPTWLSGAKDDNTWD